MPRRLRWTGQLSTRAHLPTGRQARSRAIVALTAGCVLAGAGLSADPSAVGASTPSATAGVPGKLAPAWSIRGEPASTAQSPIPAGVEGASRVQPRNGTPNLATAASVSPPTGPGQWELVDSPNGWPFGSLSAVTCVTSTDCWAMGTGIAQWTDKGWLPAASPSSDPLSGIACVSADDCWAVGSTGGSQSLIEEYDGTSWSLDAGSPDGGALADVTCLSATDCWAVGASIEHLTSSGWSITQTVASGELSSVTCASAIACWAVGGVASGSSPPDEGTTLIEEYSGSSWSTVTTGNEGELTSVTCVDAGDCWAVGSAYLSPYEQGLAETNQGTGWTVAPNPDSALGNEDFALQGVTCASALDCWAVGWSGTAYFQYTLILQLTGSGWAAVYSPDTAGYNSLSAVVCLNAVICWAVGTGAGTIQEELQQPPGPWTIAGGQGDDVLYGDTCAGPDECWAVGTNAVTPDALIEEDTGGGWGTVTSPDAGGVANNILDGVACADPSDCWAVGYYRVGEGASQPLLERYDGSTWSIVGSTSQGLAGAEDVWLLGVTCARLRRSAGRWVSTRTAEATIIPSSAATMEPSGTSRRRVRAPS